MVACISHCLLSNRSGVRVLPGAPQENKGLDVKSNPFSLAKICSPAPFPARTHILLHFSSGEPPALKLIPAVLPRT